MCPLGVEVIMYLMVALQEQRRSSTAVRDRPLVGCVAGYWSEISVAERPAIG